MVGSDSSAYLPQLSALPSSPVLHFLPTSLLQLSLPLTLPALCSCRLGRATGHHASHSSFESTVGGPCAPDAVQRNDSVNPPPVVSDQRDKGNGTPRPIEYIPHELGQSFGVEVLASSLQLSIDIGGTSDALEPEFDDECRSIEQKVKEEIASTEDQQAQDQIQSIDGEGDLVSAVEGGRIGLCLCFQCFLWSFVNAVLCRAGVGVLTLAMAVVRSAECAQSGLSRE